MGLAGKSTAVQLFSTFWMSLNILIMDSIGLYTMTIFDPIEIVQEQTISKLQLPWQILLLPPKITATQAVTPYRTDDSIIDGSIQTFHT